MYRVTKEPDARDNIHHNTGLSPLAVLQLNILRSSKRHVRRLYAIVVVFVAMEASDHHLVESTAQEFQPIAAEGKLLFNLNEIQIKLKKNFKVWLPDRRQFRSR